MDDKLTNNFLEVIKEFQREEREQKKKIKYLEKELDATKSRRAKFKGIIDEIYNIYKSEFVRIDSANVDNSCIVCNDIEVSTEHMKMLNKSLPELEKLDKVYALDEMAKILEIEQSDIMFYHHKLNDFLNISCIGTFQLYSREDVENLRRIKHLHVDLKMNMQDIKQYLKINRQEVLLNKSQELEKERQSSNEPQTAEELRAMLDADFWESKITETTLDKSSTIEELREPIQEKKARRDKDIFKIHAKRKTGKQKLEEALAKYKSEGEYKGNDMNKKIKSNRILTDLEELVKDIRISELKILRVYKREEFNELIHMRSNSRSMHNFKVVIELENYRFQEVLYHSERRYFVIDFNEIDIVDNEEHAKYVYEVDLNTFYLLISEISSAKLDVEENIGIERANNDLRYTEEIVKCLIERYIDKIKL